MDDLSSGGDSRTEEETERRSTREKEGKDHDRDREEGMLQSLMPFFSFFCR